ncbi:MAG: NADPH-dependent 7-cyano-7-deazaguanine reductase QueF [Oligoflexales bacterium]|nr:NADPH-dependent 7-cyano-7-deazaguanine reductase QueF [Oligoflexales bacterium]
MNNPESSELGKTTVYPKTYDKSLLFPIPRSESRERIGITGEAPFFGYDIWNAWEVSFLNLKGMPGVYIATIFIPSDSKCIVESKSLKLYFNSLNEHRFNSPQHAQSIISRDLSDCVGAVIQVSLCRLEDFSHQVFKPIGICLDDIDLNWEAQPYSASLLKADETKKVSESLYSNLLKSNCPVTSQPDWATVFIEYEGSKLNHGSLLEYILSFRDHNEFHEQCVERIYQDISKISKPKSLTVSARYTRRGGIDINPIRSSKPLINLDNHRLVRQ